MQNTKIKEETEFIINCLNNVLNSYNQNKIHGLTELENYTIYEDMNDEKIAIILNNYLFNCENYEIFKTNNGELQNYEKAACLAIAIKENPCFEMTDKLGIINYSILNSIFAIDVALKLCEPDLINDNILDINSTINSNDMLSYSKQLLVNILEQKYVYPSDISENIKLEIDLINNFFRIKNFQKIKKINY